VRLVRWLVIKFISTARIATRSITLSLSKPNRRLLTVKEPVAHAAARFARATENLLSNITCCENGPDLIHAHAEGSA
jgi:hypothetical protein